jgi:hypothetical protein
LLQCPATLCCRPASFSLGGRIDPSGSIARVEARLGDLAHSDLRRYSRHLLYREMIEQRELN